MRALLGGYPRGQTLRSCVVEVLRIRLPAPGTRVNPGGRTMVGPIGRGVPREEPAVHFAGRQPAGRVRVSTSKEPSPARAASRVVAGRARRVSGPSPAMAACTLPIECWPAKPTPCDSSVDVYMPTLGGSGPGRPHQQTGRVAEVRRFWDSGPWLIAPVLVQSPAGV
jgi:hypothetical protein